MPYKNIFFDLDRTLWDFETNSHETLTELIAKYKLKEKGIDSDEEFIRNYYLINDRMWEEYSKGLIDKTELRYGRFQKALQHYNIDEIHTAKSLADDYIAYSPLKTNLFPHTAEVLQYLSDKYTLHIITNGFEEVQYIKLKNCNIQHHFNQIITSERAGYKKPDKEIFEYSLNAANATTHNSLMIGDSLDADILGARNAGIHQVFFNPKEQQHTENITHEIRELKDLMSLL